MRLWSVLKTKELVYLEDWFKKAGSKTDIVYKDASFNDYYGKGMEL